MIDALRNQTTIARTAVVDGFGYWSGRNVRVEFRSAPANTGVVFVRRDLRRPIPIPAVSEKRVDAQRRTIVENDGARVEMIEHVMAALAGLRIDNCEVHVDAPELPGCDGSCGAFVEALDAAGVVTLDAPRPVLVIDKAVRLGNDDAWIEANAATAPGISIDFTIDYGSTSPIGKQRLALSIRPDAFRDELARSRTFMLKAEAEWVQSQGLAQRTTAADLLVFDETGPIDNQLRFPDECVRHKILDMIGDLALAGCDLYGHFTAYRSGHRLNGELVHSLLTTGQLVTGQRRIA